MFGEAVCRAEEAMQTAEKQAAAYYRAVVDDLLIRSRPRCATCQFADLKPREDVIWLEPQLRAPVEYAEVMQGWLRAPVFMGLVVERHLTLPTSQD